MSGGTYTFFRELFQYSHHYNQELARICIENPDFPEKSLKLYCHILNAHSIWNHRIESLKPPYAVWDIHAVQETKAIDDTNFEHSLRILDRYDLNEVIAYTNTRGQSFNNTVRDILFHIINHSTYHRGQIATEFRQFGIEPLVTDYIFYKR